jgi:formyltetrahydrofolate deformylase
MANADEYILTLSCPDRPGIVHAVTGFLATRNFNIVDSQQFGDPSSKKFFMRVHFSPTSDTPESVLSSSQLKESFKETAEGMGMEYQFFGVKERPRVCILVSKIGHCLNDLLFRASTNQLKIDIPLIISNHPDFAALAASYRIPFHHLPVTAQTKAEQEERILELVTREGIELVVLARYMQVLSPRLCEEMGGRIVNIHHSFLPSFKGARPYFQAHDRGVKIIGATVRGIGFLGGLIVSGLWVGRGLFEAGVLWNEKC